MFGSGSVLHPAVSSCPVRLSIPSHPALSWVQLVMNVPYTALQFMLYESSKKLLVGEGTADEEEEGLKVQVASLWGVGRGWGG